LPGYAIVGRSCSRSIPVRVWWCPPLRRGIGDHMAWVHVRGDGPSLLWALLLSAVHSLAAASKPFSNVQTTSECNRENKTWLAGLGVVVVVVGASSSSPTASHARRGRRRASTLSRNHRPGFPVRATTVRCGHLGLDGLPVEQLLLRLHPVSNRWPHPNGCMGWRPCRKTGWIGS
jgi:hypothetical protein